MWRPGFVGVKWVKNKYYVPRPRHPLPPSPVEVQNRPEWVKQILKNKKRTDTNVEQKYGLNKFYLSFHVCKDLPWFLPFFGCYTLKAFDTSWKLCMTVYRFVLLKYILWLKEKNCGRSMADIPTPSSLADQEITSRIERQKIKWYEWLKEPLLYKVSESSKGRSRYGKTANKKSV